MLHRAIIASVDDDGDDNNNNPVLGFYIKYINICEKTKERPAFEK